MGNIGCLEKKLAFSPKNEILTYDNFSIQFTPIHRKYGKNCGVRLV